MKFMLTMVVAVVLMLALAAPALAMETGTTGKDFGAHHATHAQDMGGFTADMNPGGMHRGFSGWMQD